MNALLSIFRRTLLCLAVAAAAVARGQFMVGIAVDAPAEFRWAQERLLLNQIISGVEAELRKSDELIALMGDPKRVNTRVVAPSAALLKPVDGALRLETRQQTLATARQRYHLNSVATPTYDEDNEVAAQYTAFGETHQRDERRYTHFGQQEAMNARHKKAVENAEAVERHELEVQRKALDALRAVRTHAEAAILQSVLLASEQRVQMARGKQEQAWAELEVFRGQVGFEEARKAEADREWTETIIARMREKALAGYRAQMGGSP